MKNIVLCIIIGGFLFMLGNFIGRQSIVDSESTIITVLDPIIDTVYIPGPTSTTTPKTPNLPTKIDTVTQTQVVDTAEIIKEYILIKDYSFTLFNNQHGRLDIESTVQYNSLTDLNYTYTPITTQTIKHISTPLFTPFIMLQYNTLNTFSIGGGIFKKNLGGYYNYNVGINGIPNHSIGVIYKFQ